MRFAHKGFVADIPDTDLMMMKNMVKNGWDPQEALDETIDSWNCQTEEEIKAIMEIEKQVVDYIKRG